MRRFEGTRVVVAGCGHAVDTLPDDLGGASARAFAAEGAEVIYLQHTLDAAADVVKEVTEAGGEIRSLAADPRRTTDIIQATTEIANMWESVDVLVTHYMGSYVKGIQDTTLEQWDETIRVNATSIFLLVQGLLPLLRRSERAAIVNIGSIDGTFANPNLLAYSASKGAVNALTHALAGELASSGIRVNCAAQTASTAAPLRGDGLRSVNSATPLARVGAPEEYVAAVLFLASPEASYLTGVVLPVDGGRSAVTPGTAPGYTGYVR